MELGVWCLEFIRADSCPFGVNGVAGSVAFAPRQTLLTRRTLREHTES